MLRAEALVVNCATCGVARVRRHNEGVARKRVRVARLNILVKLCRGTLYRDNCGQAVYYPVRGEGSWC